LEDQVGVPLFERTNPSKYPGSKGHRCGIDWHTPTLTRAGQRLVARAVPFMATIDDLEQAVRIEHHRANLTPTAA
jgi:DNA-binding transcriptional LysR family regulator